MSDPKSILNIDFHTGILMVKALNKHKTLKAAAPILGIHVRSIYDYMERCGVEYDVITEKYYMNEKFANKFLTT